MAETSAKDRQAAIIEFFKKADAERPLESKPSVNETSGAVGFKISASELSKAWDVFRPAPEVRKAKNPADDWPQVTNLSKSPITIGLTNLLPGETDGVEDWKVRKEAYSIKSFLKAGLLKEA